jgi:hypothetical protein
MGAQRSDGLSLVDEDMEMLEVEHMQDEKIIDRSPTLYFFSSSSITRRLNHYTSVEKRHSAIRRIFFHGRCVRGWPWEMT